MAKKINPEDEGAAIETKQAPVNENESASTDTTRKSRASTDEVKTIEPDEHISNLLKLFPDYATMYVDQQGGVYTSTTPEVIRGEAILYKNPFYKP